MLLHSGERPRESSIILDLFQFFLFSNVNLPPCLNAHRIVNKFGNCLNLKRKKNIIVIIKRRRKKHGIPIIPVNNRFEARTEQEKQRN